MEASIALTDPDGSVHGVIYWDEGWSEPLDFPMANLDWASDSVRFQFAPSEIEVTGLCVTPDSMTIASNGPHGVFSVPGTGFMRRERAEE